MLRPAAPPVDAACRPTRRPDLAGARFVPIGGAPRSAGIWLANIFDLHRDVLDRCAPAEDAVRRPPARAPGVRRTLSPARRDRPLV
jgi:hypothetical protein